MGKFKKVWSFQIQSFSMNWKSVFKANEKTLKHVYRTKTNAGREVEIYSGELNNPSLRNSANWLRNFGRRRTCRLNLNDGWHRIGRNNCLPKTQDFAESESWCIKSDACPVLDVEREGCVHLMYKLWTDSPVNGGRNSNDPKVAKFLVH